MDTIFKYKLHVRTHLELQAGFKVLTVQEQHGEPVAWVQLDPTVEQTETRVIHSVPTGGDVDPSWRYIATVLLLQGRLVYHFYEEV